MINFPLFHQKGEMVAFNPRFLHVTRFGLMIFQHQYSQMLLSNVHYCVDRFHIHFSNSLIMQEVINQLCGLVWVTWMPLDTR